MSELRDPRRLTEGTDASLALLREGLGAARAQRPSEVQRAQLRAALGLPPAPDLDTTPPDDSPPPPATDMGAIGATKGGVVLKLVTGALVVGASIAALWQTTREPAPRPSPSTHLEPAGSAEVAPTATDSEAKQTQPARPSESPAPDPRPTERVESNAPEARPTASAKAATPPRRTARDAKADPGAELALLQRARAYVRSAPDRALGLVAEHEQSFPNGVLAQEREVIAIEALQNAAKHSEAKRRAARFRERYPRSAHARRIDELFRKEAR